MLAREAPAALRDHREHVVGVHFDGHAAVGLGTPRCRYLLDLAFQRVARLHDHLRILRTTAYSHFDDESDHSLHNLHHGARSIRPGAGLYA